MKSKELRRLSKIELLTMLRDQEEEIGQLKKQILQLEIQLNEKSKRCAHILLLFFITALCMIIYIFMVISIFYYKRY